MRDFNRLKSPALVPPAKPGGASERNFNRLKSSQARAGLVAGPGTAALLPARATFDPSQWQGDGGLNRLQPSEDHPGADGSASPALFTPNFNRLKSTHVEPGKARKSLPDLGGRCDELQPSEAHQPSRHECAPYAPQFRLRNFNRLKSLNATRRARPMAPASTRAAKAMSVE